MGFWNAVKSIANSAKCMTGWHAGEYSHRSGKPECHLEKTCPDCNEYVTKEKHVFGQWDYISFGKCDSRRECVHCKQDEFKVIHKHERVGKDPSTCKIIMRCNRCGDEKLGATEHEWITVFNREVKVSDGESKKRKCKNCGTLG